MAWLLSADETPYPERVEGPVYQEWIKLSPFDPSLHLLADVVSASARLARDHKPWSVAFHSASPFIPRVVVKQTWSDDTGCSLVMFNIIGIASHHVSIYLSNQAPENPMLGTV